MKVSAREAKDRLAARIYKEQQKAGGLPTTREADKKAVQVAERVERKKGRR